MRTTGPASGSRARTVGVDAAETARGDALLDTRACPLAWWDLHRRLPVGAPAHIAVRLTTERSTTDDGQERATGRGDDLPDQSVSQWEERLLRQVLTGAGFTVIRLEASPTPERTSVVVRRERTLADTVGPDMRLLLVGLNPSVYAADVGIGFARPGNRAWPALLTSGLVTIDRDPLHALVGHRVGMTDLVKRATVRADELSPDEFADGLVRLESLCRWLEPRAVCVLGVTGWRAATGDRRSAIGPQERLLGGRPVYVAPNPSGLNAHTSVPDLVVHLRRAVSLGGA